MQNLFRMMLVADPKSRQGLNALVDSPWVQDHLIKALKYLEKIHEKNENQKIQFLAGFMKVVEKYDHKILVRKILPLLCECWKDPRLAAPVLTILMQLLKGKKLISKGEF